MNSRQRFLNAIRFQPVDHTPLYLRLRSLGNGEDHIPFPWKDQVSRAESLLRLGLDDTLLLQPPLGCAEEYRAELSQGVEQVTRLCSDPTAAGMYPLVKKVYHTPLGRLTQVVKITADWPHGEDIPLFSDFNVPRLLEPLIKKREEIARLRYLLSAPSASQLADFRTRSHRLHWEAQRLGVALEGGWTALGDALLCLCGMNNVLFWQMDQPEVLEDLLDVLLEWELRRIDLLLEEGIDVLVHVACFEGVKFWTPKNYRRLLRPRLQQIIDRAHARHVPFRYIINNGWKPLRQDFLEMGIDCLTGVDPLQDHLDLLDVRRQVGGQISLMGGLNAPVSLAVWTEEEIRQAVRQAIDILASDGGFILFPVDNVCCDLPWENVAIVIDEWKKTWQAPLY